MFDELEKAIFEASKYLSYVRKMKFLSKSEIIVIPIKKKISEKERKPIIHGTLRELRIIVLTHYRITLVFCSCRDLA